MIVLPAAAAAFLIWLYRRGLIERRFFLLFLILDLAGAAWMLQERGQSELNRISSIPETAEAEGSHRLEVEAGSRRYPVQVEVPYRKYTEKEAQEELAAVKRKLPHLILGKNSDPEKIRYPLDLPDRIPESGTAVSWYSSDPDVLGDDGAIGPGIPDKGKKVVLSAELRLSGEQESFRQELRVYPPAGTAGIAERIRKETERINENTESKVYRLPDQVDGIRLKWYRTKKRRGGLFCLLAVFGGAAAVFAKRQKKEKNRIRQKEEAERVYPELVGKLQLYLAAGLSMRSAFLRLSRGYQRQRKEGTARSEAYEAVCRCAAQMENGRTELSVYRAFGMQMGTASYRRLALLLTQNLQKGGAGLLPLLEREVQNAYQQRRRRARAEGEKISTKLLLPMSMMLAVVLALILLPAMQSVG